MLNKNISGFINKIVINSKAESFKELASIEAKRIKEELLGSGAKISKIDDEVIKEIAKAHIMSYISTKDIYEKNIVVKIRLNNRLCNDLYYSDWDGKDYNISPGEYIKILLEEYVRKPIFGREMIFYKDLLEEINRYINIESEEKQILLITMTNKKKHLFKPYRMSENYEANYHYLIGLSFDERKNRYKPASIRLSRIKDVRAKGRSFGSGKITHKEEKDILDAIESRGIPYLLTGAKEHKVRLTEDGMGMYNNIYHQRPVYKENKYNGDGTYTMTIDATDIQISNYFFQFDKEAVVISPEKTREIMRERFENAASNYKIT